MGGVPHDCPNLRQHPVFCHLLDRVLLDRVTVLLDRVLLFSSVVTELNSNTLSLFYHNSSANLASFQDIKLTIIINQRPCHWVTLGIGLLLPVPFLGGQLQVLLIWASEFQQTLKSYTDKSNFESNFDISQKWSSSV